MTDRILDRREYLSTHPWLTFSVDLRRAPAQLWVLLGEARSKIGHLEWVPLRPEKRQEFHRVFLAKGIRATTAIEGNTLSEEQVLQRIEGQLELPPSQQYLGQEIDNVINAVNGIANDLVREGPASVNQGMIREYNRLVLHDLPLEDNVMPPGEIRKHPVVVGNYRGVPWQDCDYLLDHLCEWLDGDDFIPQSDQPDMREALVIIKAILAHLYLAWIHPFADGNGRTSRLIEFQMLVSSGVPLPAAHLLSNHYNLTRAEYYRQLDVSSKSGGDVIPFLLYAVQGFVDGLREQIRLVREQIAHVTWEHYVYGAFGQVTNTTGMRRRRLVLDLAAHGEPATRGELVQLTPRLAEFYSAKTRKTLTRDLNWLRDRMELVVQESDGRFRARTELLQDMMPSRVVDPSALPE